VRTSLERLVKAGLFVCLALTFWKGFSKLPEVLPVLHPQRFATGQINDGENSLFMKQRHFDINYQTGKALSLRIEELKTAEQSPPQDALVTLERAENALRKTQAKDLRNANDLTLAEEKLGRAKRRAAEGWSLGAACPAGDPGPAAGAKSAAGPDAKNGGSGVK